MLARDAAHISLATSEAIMSTCPFFKANACYKLPGIKVVASSITCEQCQSGAFTPSAISGVTPGCGGCGKPATPDGWNVTLPSRGAGDVAAKAIHAAGAVLARMANRCLTPCGACQRRQARMNKWIPFFWKKP